MKLNEDIAIFNPKVVLVPYCKNHVPTYHEWMQDPDLQTATASDPLTLDEEYAMQKSWRDDHDKLTFIACLPLRSERSIPTDGIDSVQSKIYDNPQSMIGDINLFLFEEGSDSEHSVVDGEDTTNTLIGEIELMVARKDLHRQGYGRATLLTFMEYVLSNWQRITQEYGAQGESSTSTSEASKLLYLRAKILENNDRSIKLFKSVGFEQIGEDSNYFGEFELRWHHDVDYLRRLKGYQESKQLRYTTS